MCCSDWCFVVGFGVLFVCCFLFDARFVLWLIALLVCFRFGFSTLLSCGLGLFCCLFVCLGGWCVGLWWAGYGFRWGLFGGVVRCWLVGWLLGLFECFWVVVFEFWLVSFTVGCLIWGGFNCLGCLFVVLWLVALYDWFV